MSYKSLFLILFGMCNLSYSMENQIEEKLDLDQIKQAVNPEFKSNKNYNPTSLLNKLVAERMIEEQKAMAKPATKKQSKKGNAIALHLTEEDIISAAIESDSFFKILLQKTDR